jgi:hypothetical protein
MQLLVCACETLAKIALIAIANINQTARLIFGLIRRQLARFHETAEQVAARMSSGFRLSKPLLLEGRRARLKRADGGDKSGPEQATRKVMMKRVVFLLTTVFGAALLAGCGKLEDQEPVAKDTGAQTNAAAHGSGALTLSDGRTAVETNVEAQRSFVMRDGTVYEGGMKDGKPDGRGTVTNPNGTFQKGEWRDGRPYRISGIWVAPDGTKEEGTWNYDGSASGGTILWKDGQTYKGDWEPVDGRTDLPDGTGAMTWPDGRQYAGHFRGGKMDGIGKMTWPDGRVEDGTWTQDAFQGSAK